MPAPAEAKPAPKLKRSDLEGEGGVEMNKREARARCSALGENGWARRVEGEEENRGRRERRETREGKRGEKKGGRTRKRRAGIRQRGARQARPD